MVPEWSVVGWREEIKFFPIKQSRGKYFRSSVARLSTFKGPIKWEKFYFSQITIAEWRNHACRGAIRLGLAKYCFVTARS